eukprot:TRINITY_DN2358_c0_g1_i1.p1 TRINITY_DN2358_c0_g1~~TRINITY_DN2358_c0_g1_i1.p1  ORF type:complete len:255 (-),score=35.45 TRINITY_DN2358_c0_g1_i1:85-849(-)
MEQPPINAQPIISHTPKHTLFVSSLPSLSPEDFASLFSSIEGFQDARLAQDRNGDTVGFVDYSTLQAATKALESYNEYKFHEADEKGIIIDFSRGGNKRARPRAPGQGPTGQPQNSMGITGGVAKMSLYSNPFAPMQAAPMPTQFPQVASQIALPPNASETLYVQGLPGDIHRREIAHIFRPWAGYQSTRLIQKESTQFPDTMHTLCFVEFESSLHATMAMHALQGYRLDEDDVSSPMLSITYAKNKRPKKQWQ